MSAANTQQLQEWQAVQHLSFGCSMTRASLMVQHSSGWSGRVALHSRWWWCVLLVVGDSASLPVMSMAGLSLPRSLSLVVRRELGRAVCLVAALGWCLNDTLTSCAHDHAYLHQSPPAPLRTQCCLSACCPPTL